MKIETEQHDTITLIKPIARRLDASVALRFKEEVLAIIQRGEPRLVLDFARVDFIDSSCLGSLVSLLKAANGKSTLVLCSLNSNIKNMFSLTRMDRVFTLCETAEDAFAALSPKA